MLVTVGMGENGVFDVLFLLEKCVTPVFPRRVYPIGSAQKLVFGFWQTRALPIPIQSRGNYAQGGGLLIPRDLLSRRVTCLIWAVLSPTFQC